MPIDSVSVNQPVQGQLQPNTEIPNPQKRVSKAGAEIGKSLVKSLPKPPAQEQAALGKPLSRLYHQLSNLKFRFKSFFSPGNLKSAQNLPFPFKLSYQVQTLDSAEGTTAGHPAFEVPRSALLADVAYTRQGLVQIRSDSEQCLGSTIFSCLNAPEFDQGISLNENQKIVGCYIRQESAHSTQWRLQVYDSAEEETVEVPLTVIKLKDTETNNLQKKMSYIKVAMDRHLQAIHPAYRDSVKQPIVMCQTKPELANLVVAQEELLSRLYSGQCKNIHHMDRQIDEVLHLVSPERPLLESHEEEMTFRSNLLEAYENNSKNKLMGKGMSFAHQIRASRRHMPVPDFPITAIPLGVVKAPVTAKPAMPDVRERAIVAPASADVFTPTLAGRTPLTRPSQLLEPFAYKEPLKQMQCAVNSVNTFFQTEVMTSEKMAKTVIEKMRDFGQDLSGLDGLGHPDLVAAVERGETIIMSKADFLGPKPDEKPKNDLLHNGTPAQQWQDLINASAPLGPGKDWVNNKDELDGIERLAISPSDWLSAYSGVSIDLLGGTFNSLLETAKDDPTWDHMPKAVFSHQLVDDRLGKREDKIKALVNEVNDTLPNAMRKNQEFQMVVLTGSGNHGGNHFFTIAYNKPNDNWISLNSDRTVDKGQQRCEVFCENDKLQEKLLDGVYAVLTPFDNTTLKGTESPASLHRAW